MSFPVIIFLILLGALHVIGALATVAQVGKHRDPLTPSTAALVVLLNLCIAGGILAVLLTR